MAESQPVILTFSNKGLDLRSTTDEIAIEEYAALSNWVTDHEGALNSRRGYTRINANVLESDVHTLTRLNNRSNAYRYAGADDSLFRAADPSTNYSEIIPGAVRISSVSYQVGDLVQPSPPNGHVYICTTAGTTSGSQPPFTTVTAATVDDGSVVWQENNLSGLPMFSVAYPVGIDLNPWQFFSDSHLMLKDNGSGAPELMGITAPSRIGGSPAVDLPTVKDVETFQTPPTGYWITVDGAASEDTISPDSLAGTSYGNSLKLTVSGGGGPVDASVAHVVALDLSSFGGSAITTADSSKIFITCDSPEFLTRLTCQFSIGDHTFTERYEANLDLTQLSADVWVQFSTPLSDFTKIASSDSVDDWSNIQAIRLLVSVDNGGADVWFDQWQISGGGSLSGSTYQWRYIYRNSATGSISNPSPATDSLQNSPSRQSVSTTLTYSRDPQVDAIDVFRIGGTATTFRFSGTVVNLPFSPVDTVQYSDNVPDVNLGDILQTDNARPPNFAGIELHNNTIFGWGAASDPLNVVRYSKIVNVEQFPPSNLLFIGSGSERVIQLIEQGEQLYAITTANVYRIIGSDPSSYQALNTGYSRGITSAFAVISPPGSLILTCFDGIYEFPGGKKLSQPIDGVFHGMTINGILPINVNELDKIRTEFFDNKLYVHYPAGTSTVNNAAMVLDVLYERWLPQDRAGRTMYTENDTNILLMGKTDGNIYQVEAGATDNGAPISLALWTKSFYLNSPGADKKWTDFALEVDTQSQNLTAQLVFNNGDFVDTPLVVNTSHRTLVSLPIANGIGIDALNCQLRVTGTVSSANPVSLYRAIIYTLPQPPSRVAMQTDWTDKGYPYDKYWKELLLEIDTGSRAATVHLDIDNVNDVDTFSVTTNGRQRVTLSIKRDIVGKLARLRVAGAGVKLYGYDYVIEQEPPDVTIADSLEQAFGYDRYKLLKRVWIAMKAPSAVTMKIFADEILKATEVIPATTAGTGWQKNPIILPPNIKGKLFRFVFTSDARFKIYFHQSEVEHRPINTERGFARYKFNPPQLS